MSKFKMVGILILALGVSGCTSTSTFTYRGNLNDWENVVISCKSVKALDADEFARAVSEVQALSESAQDPAIVAVRQINELRQECLGGKGVFRHIVDFLF